MWSLYGPLEGVSLLIVCVGVVFLIVKPARIHKVAEQRQESL